MKTVKLFDHGHTWLAFGRDPDKVGDIIDTNQYMVKSGSRVLLLDPGGIEIFAPMLSAVLHYAKIEEITDLFASHQDPDVISSLGLWDQTLPQATLHAPWVWEGFIRHFGMSHIRYHALPDEGGTLDLSGVTLTFVPAHYLHSSGNFHVYDPIAKVLMTGDIGASLEPAGTPMFVEDFESHTKKMREFHRRWMPSNRAKNDWVARVRALDIDMLCPQHGRIFRGDDVARFLDWFEELEVASALEA
ncbi:MAG: MBL fold metallo-hydrolase [Polyangiaceae bacterium]